MPSQRQAILRSFYGDFGTRIAFIREKRGMGLAELGNGKASTAKSWEAGSRPKPEKWEELAVKLNLSSSFVMTGKPRLQSDYDFIAKYGDEIGPPPDAKTLRGDVFFSRDNVSAVHETQAPYGVPTPARAATPSPPHVPPRRPVELTPPYRLPAESPTEKQCIEYLASVLADGRDIGGAAGHVYLELRAKFPRTYWDQFRDNPTQK